MSTIDSVALIFGPGNLSRYIDQCVEVSGGSYFAAAQVRLLDDQSANLTTAPDPSTVTLELAAFSRPDCLEEPLSEQITQLNLTVDEASQVITARLAAAEGSRGLRMRITGLPDAADGVQPEANRDYLWDNLLLRRD